jgi:hypothetical protein
MASNTSEALLKVHEAPMRCAMEVRISQSARASPGASTAFRTLWTVLQVFVNVPSFSAQHAAGRTTSASCAVSVRKISWTTSRSSFSREWRTWCVSGSVTMGFSPMMNRALIPPFPAASIILTTERPGVAGISIPFQAAFIFSRTSGLDTF